MTCCCTLCCQLQLRCISQDRLHTKDIYSCDACSAAFCLLQNNVQQSIFEVAPQTTCLGTPSSKRLQIGCQGHSFTSAMLMAGSATLRRASLPYSAE